jgi:hypothetical protein
MKPQEIKKAKTTVTNQKMRNNYFTRKLKWKVLNRKTKHQQNLTRNWVSFSVLTSIFSLLTFFIWRLLKYLLVFFILKNMMISHGQTLNNFCMFLSLFLVHQSNPSHLISLSCVDICHTHLHFWHGFILNI